MSEQSQAYLDIVGGVERSWPRAYDGVIALVCPNCGADPMELCTNPITRLPRKSPCILRVARGCG
jgi:hypothetical protein